MNILVFGSTGSAGGSVLRACLAAPAVGEARAIVRRPLALEHRRLRSIVQTDFLDFTGVESAFDDVAACLFCLGISVTQVSGEAEYRRITHDFALAAARTLKARSPTAIFHFLSARGAHLDSRMMWARVKAETERDLIASCAAVCWRPAFIDGEASRNAPRLYQALRPLARLFRSFRGSYVAGEDIGRAMLQATGEGVRGRVIENAEIRDLADRHRRATASAEG